MPVFDIRYWNISFKLAENLLNEGIGILSGQRFIICSTHTDSTHMVSQISGTIASSGVCYNDKHRMPCKLKALRCVASNCLPQEVEVRKWMNGYHIIRSYPNDRYRKTNAKSNGYVLQQGPNVRCHSYGSRSSSETKECNIPEDGIFMNWRRILGRTWGKMGGITRKTNTNQHTRPWSFRFRLHTLLLHLGCSSLLLRLLAPWYRLGLPSCFMIVVYVPKHT